MKMKYSELEEWFDENTKVTERLCPKCKLVVVEGYRCEGCGTFYES
jgi:methionyl-tRNA synthetase